VLGTTFTRLLLRERLQLPILVLLTALFLAAEVEELREMVPVTMPLVGVEQAEALLAPVFT
jgi:hypothetical protein